MKKLLSLLLIVLLALPSLGATSAVSRSAGKSLNYDWTAGNVQTCSGATNATVNACITAATAGDTIKLISGNVAITDSINVNKAVNIVGQGIGKTTITTATAEKKAFVITASNARISDLSIAHSGYGNNAAGVLVNGTAGTVLSGVELQNLDIRLTDASSNVNQGIYFSDAGGTVRNVKVINSSTNAASYAFVHSNASTAEAATTVIVYDSFFQDTAGYGAASFDNTASQDSIFYLYNTTAAGKYGMASLNGSDAFLYAYGGVASGVTNDLIQSSSATLTVFGTTLTNNTVSGTITLAGTTATGKITAGRIPYTADALAEGIITTTATTQRGLTIQGTAGQSAALQTWQASDGTVLSSLNSAGALNTSSYLAAASDGTAGLYLQNAASANIYFYGISNAAQVKWDSAVAGTPDLGLSRSAAGVAKVTNGSTGYGTLEAKDVIATASVRTSSLLVNAYASTRWASGATAGSIKLINDANGSDNCSADENGGVGTSYNLCVSDGANWVDL